jgi:rare lipoprotein A
MTARPARWMHICRRPGTAPARGGKLAGAIFLILCLAILAGCSSSPSKRSPSSSSTTTGGGYYKDDGPGNDIPPNIQAIPDAVPRIEAHARANMRPYVVFGKRYTPVSGNRPFRQTGTASWYGRKFHGNKTANGEIYDMYAMTAAHPTLPLPSYARVTHARNGKSVIVRVNDRGPFHSARIIDLSYAAAAKLGLIAPGSGQVIVEAITHDEINRKSYQPSSAPPPNIQPLQPAPPPEPAPLLIADSQPQADNQPDALEALIQNRTSSTSGSSGQATNNPLPTQNLLHTSATAASPAPVSGNQIYLQYGAFNASQAAHQLAQSLNVDISTVEHRQAQVIPADALYRVQIGPYPSRTEAVNAAVRIEEQTGRQGSLTFR